MGMMPGMGMGMGGMGPQGGMGMGPPSGGPGMGGDMGDGKFYKTKICHKYDDMIPFSGGRGCTWLTLQSGNRSPFLTVDVMPCQQPVLDGQQRWPSFYYCDC